MTDALISSHREEIINMNITKRGEQIGVIADTAVLNEQALNARLKDQNHKEVNLDDFRGQTVLLSVFPDINTSVCDLQTRHFFKEASNYDNVTILNVSNNKVEELGEWCATQGIDATMLSDEDLDFGKGYGIYIPEVKLLARSTFLIDKNGKLVYKEVISEITNEPNYEAVFAKAKEIA